MNFNNLIDSLNPCTVFVLPMLGKHPDEYPNFCNCFLKDATHPEYDNYIHVYTQAGDIIRGHGRELEELYNHPNFVTTLDDNSFAPTGVTFVFSVPKRWEDDFDKIINGKAEDISEAYKAEVYHMYPQLKRVLDLFFQNNNAKTNNEERGANMNIDKKTEDVIANIITELHRAEHKFPQWPVDKIHASAIVAEEAGELVRAALQHKYESGDFDAMRIEAIQTGAMAVRFLKELYER